MSKESLKQISYKLIYDEEGNFRYIEIWQEDRYIAVSLGSTGISKESYKWEIVKENINGFREKINRDLSGHHSNSSEILRRQMVEEGKIK